MVAEPSWSAYVYGLLHNANDDQYAVVIGVDGRMVAPVIVIGVIVPGVVPCAATTGVTVSEAVTTWPWNAAAVTTGVTSNVALIVWVTVAAAAVDAVTVNAAVTVCVFNPAAAGDAVTVNDADGVSV